MQLPGATHRNIYVGSERVGDEMMESATRFITNRLKLKVNQAKSALARPRQRKFLGFNWSRRTLLLIVGKLYLVLMPKRVYFC